MEKDLLLDKIQQEVSSLDDAKLKEVFDFVRFLNHREIIDPTLEIMQNEDDYLNIKEGLRQKEMGQTYEWDSVK